jgi:hypothetical protein
MVAWLDHLITQNLLGNSKLYFYMFDPSKKISWRRAGMHNIRPAGEMWPAEAFNLARELQNFILSLIKTLFECVET